MDGPSAGRPPVIGNITRRTINSLFWTFSGSGIQAGLRIISVVVLARLLTPEEFGVMGAALVVIGLSTLFSQLGMGPAIIQRPVLEERHLRTAFTVSVLLSLVFAGGVVLSSSAIAAFFRFEALEAVLKAVSLLFPIHGISAVATSLLKRSLRFRTIAVIQTASFAIGYVLVGLVLAALDFGVWSLVCAHLASAAISTTALLFAQPCPKKPQIERAAFAELMKFGGGFTIARLFNYGALNGDYIVAGRWIGATALGLYTRAYQLLVFPVNLFASVLDVVLFPSMALVQKDQHRLEVAYRRGEGLIALGFMPLGVFAMVVAPEIVTIALGSQWTDVVGPFRILAAGMFFRAGYKVSDSLARATGAVYRRAWRQAVYATATLSGSWLGQHYGGLEGLAYGVLGALAVNFILMNHLSLSLTETSWRSFLAIHWGGVKFAVVTLVAVGAAATSLRAIGAPDIVVFLAAILAMGLTVVVPAYLRPHVLGAEGDWMVATLKGIASEKFAARAAGRRSDNAPS